jgi:hypothetical protein
MSVDTELANSLLNKKYDSEGREIKTSISLPFSPENMRNPARLSRQNTAEVDWKFLAQERLQIITEFQDAKNAWWEAWKLEKERADRLEAKLFSYMSGFVEEVQEIKEEQEIQKLQQEIKHSISSPAQVNRKRANWPSVKAQLEKKFSLSEDTKETKETEDKGE